MIRVGIMGASGYGGGELLRLLSLHREVEVAALTSKTYEGQPLGQAFPGWIGTNLTFVSNHNDLGQFSTCSVVFLAGADGASIDAADELLNAGCKVIDLSASFRFSDHQEYEHWYGEPHRATGHNEHAVYGLPELHREELRVASLVGNPGCYPTAALLALVPLLRHGLVDLNSLIIDGKSGVSGAGRSKFGLDYHFAEMNENAWAYKVAGSHRHTGEIEQELSAAAGLPLYVTFTPHVVPMTRGVLVTCYANIQSGVTHDQIASVFSESYAAEPFVHVLNDLPATKNTLGSNHCHIGFGCDSRTNRLTVTAVIDNLGKGMAGQAVQNMNIMFGFPETEGLKGVSLWP